MKTNLLEGLGCSRFLLLRKELFSATQREVILQFVEEKMMGKKILSSESTEEEIQKIFSKYRISGNDCNIIRKALQNGKAVYYESLPFDTGCYDYADLFIEIWGELQEKSEEDFQCKMISGLGEIGLL